MHDVSSRRVQTDLLQKGQVVFQVPGVADGSPWTATMSVAMKSTS
jgi:hypothetical protein